LLRLSTGIAAAQDEDQVCDAIVQGLRDEHIGYSFVGLFLLDPATGDRVMRAAVGWSGLPAGWRVPAGQGLSATVLETGRIQYTPDVTKEPRYVPGLSSGSEVDVPLLIDGVPGGVLVVESDRPQAFGEEDFAILTAAANQGSIAITRARLLAEQQGLLAAERRRADEQAALVASLATSRPSSSCPSSWRRCCRVPSACSAPPAGSWQRSTRRPASWRSLPT